MTDTAAASPASRLNSAFRRLERAAARVEAAAQNCAPSGPDPETAQLRAELKTARAEYQALEKAANTISGRLDAAMKRLRGVLES